MKNVGVYKFQNLPLFTCKVWSWEWYWRRSNDVWFFYVYHVWSLNTGARLLEYRETIYVNLTEKRRQTAQSRRICGQMKSASERHH